MGLVCLCDCPTRVLFEFRAKFSTPSSHRRVRSACVRIAVAVSIPLQCFKLFMRTDRRTWSVRFGFDRFDSVDNTRIWQRRRHFRPPIIPVMLIAFQNSVKTDLFTERAISRLYIANAKRQDSGNYSCALGEVSRAVVLVHVLNGAYFDGLLRRLSSEIRGQHTRTWCLFIPT